LSCRSLLAKEEAFACWYFSSASAFVKTSSFAEATEDRKATEDKTADRMAGQAREGASAFVKTTADKAGEMLHFDSWRVVSKP
jgi:hypothetical protein